MRAGRLRNRIRIERSTPTSDAAGSPIKVWVTLVERDAAISFVSGREFFALGQDVSESTVRISIREIPDLPGRLDGELRAIDVDTGAIYDVTAVLPTAARNDVLLACKMGGGRAA